jgi:hypothetical protein
VCGSLQRFFEKRYSVYRHYGFWCIPFLTGIDYK